MLQQSNGGVVDLIQHSLSPTLGYRHDLNPFAGVFGELLLNCRSLGMHSRSTAANVIKFKIEAKEKEKEKEKEKGKAKTKDYLNLIRYANLAEQIRHTMTLSKREFNLFLGFSAADYRALSPELRDFQRELLQKRRSRASEVERNEGMEAALMVMLADQKDFFIKFTGADPADYTRDKRSLTTAINDVCARTIHGLVVEIGLDSLSVEQRQRQEEEEEEELEREKQGKSAQTSTKE